MSERIEMNNLIYCTGCSQIIDGGKFCEYCAESKKRRDTEQDTQKEIDMLKYAVESWRKEAELNEEIALNLQKPFNSAIMLLTAISFQTLGDYDLYKEKARVFVRDHAPKPLPGEERPSDNS